MNPSITDNAVYRALGGFLSSAFGCQVIRGQVNEVSMPQGTFILMNDVWKKALSTNAHAYTKKNSGQVSIKTPIEYCIQVNFYGEGSGEMASTFITLSQDAYAFDGFPAGIKILYATLLKQDPLITGEKNFLERWATEVHIQINPTVTTPADYAEELIVSVNLANGKIIS